MEKGRKGGDYRETAEQLNAAAAMTVRGVVEALMEKLDKEESRCMIHLGQGDPSAFPCFRTTPLAEDAMVDALRSAKFNCYSSSVGILPARRAIAEYLSSDLPEELSPDDVYVTVGCTQAIEIIISVIAARPGANILLPKPGYPMYEARAAFSKLEVRHFDLLPEKGWEVDLDAVEALADENTVAMVIVSPGNPCGNVFTHQHLKKVAETARKLGIFVIADEVYDHLVFGNKPFVPMAKFGSIVPIVDSIKSYINISSDVATFTQGAIPQILEKTNEDFFCNIINTLKRSAEICYSKIKEIPCMDCPQKPEGSMSVMVKLNLSLLQDISDDMDFCLKLAEEESVIVLPGFAVGLKNWLRITFAVEPASLGEGLNRIIDFCKRHAKQK
ncbi:hypothetical protein LWI29_024473 [Acer saccharum]|uniref:Aminotransferase class I/classII large domain-containing protein n=1 Tax=Acer saccharum TaxID=4024 RepID=A0AA39VTM5_ACESA|nr:hypothetical protein LWI29_024473 [Acer saccharum]